MTLIFNLSVKCYNILFQFNLINLFYHQNTCDDVLLLLTSLFRHYETRNCVMFQTKRIKINSNLNLEKLCQPK